MDDDYDADLATVLNFKGMLEEGVGLTHESQFAGCVKTGKATVLGGQNKKKLILLRLVFSAGTMP